MAHLTTFKALPLNDQATEYYASWFYKADYHQLSQFSSPIKAYLHILAFIKHQFYKRQDTLVDISEPVITVSTKMVQDGICLSLSDNGKGFPDHVRMRVFEPYVTTKLKGTGLGLPIVKKIVEEHNGTIQIENIQPHGARIAITLPTVSEDDSTITHEIT